MIHRQIACSLDNYTTWYHNSEQNWFADAESLQEGKEVKKLDFCRLFSDTWLHPSHWSGAHISLVQVAGRSLVNFSFSCFRGRMPRYMANLCQALGLLFDLLHGSHDSRVPISRKMLLVPHQNWEVTNVNVFFSSLNKIRFGWEASIPSKKN